MFNLFKKKPGGSLKYYGLWDWWISTFSEKEREIITSTFQPLGAAENPLTEGEASYSSRSAVSLLSSLARWFKNEDQRTLAYKILEKADELADKASVLDQHFLYQVKIEVYYRFRDIDDFALSRAKEGCKQQIALSPEAAKAFKDEYGDQVLPSHVGFKQLAIIKDKEGDWAGAIEVCERALNEGWDGDWGRRIERYEKKMNKESS